MKTNFFSYEIQLNNTSRGFFNIYQGKNGGIYLMMGNTITLLQKKQIEELRLPLHELKEFDADDYNHFYNKV